MKVGRSFIPAQGDIFVRNPHKTTLEAWKPYCECVSILFEFQNSELDDEHPEWRISWFAGIALLRTIGHVLDKVDAKASAIHEAEILRLWNCWKQDKVNNWIFWEFIEQERNNILKTFKFGVTTDGEGLFYPNLDADGAQLFREAVYWWRNQLEALEANLP